MEEDFGGGYEEYCDDLQDFSDNEAWKDSQAEMADFEHEDEDDCEDDCEGEDSPCHACGGEDCVCCEYFVGQ